MSPRPPTFPFGLDSLDQYNSDVDVQALGPAAKAGDIAVIERIEQRFGGALYNESITRNAIDTGHLFFLERYLILCRWHLISTREHPMTLQMVVHDWEYYLAPIEAARSARVDATTRYHAVRIIVERFLPSLPKRDEVVVRDGAVRRLPPHGETIWALNDFRRIVNDAHGRRLMAGFISVKDDRIYRYLAEEVGLRFDLDALKYWSVQFNPRVYQFVLDHLDASVDKEALPPDCLVSQEPNDADFFDFLVHFLESGEYHRTPPVPWVLEFLEHHPQFVPRIPSLMRELQKTKPDCFIAREVHHAIAYALDDPRRIPDFLRLLQQVRNQLPAIQYEEPFDLYCKTLEDRLWEQRNSGGGAATVSGDQFRHDCSRHTDIYRTQGVYREYSDDEDDDHPFGSGYPDDDDDDDTGIVYL